MSYIIDVNVSSDALAGIQGTLEEGLLGFVEATNKLRKASDEAKDGIDLTRELATIKTALEAMSGAIAEATTTEIVKIALAMTNIGTALSRVAEAVDAVDIGQRLQTSVDGFVARFAASLEASLSHNHGSSTTPSNTTTGKTQESIHVQTIDITGRINDAIFAHHFHCNEIDLTDRVNYAIHPWIFTAKNISLTERIQLAIDTMQVGANKVQVTSVTTPTKSTPSKPPEGDRTEIGITSDQIVSRLRFDPISISAADIVAQISIAAVNIRDMVADAIASGGGVDLHKLIADEIAASRSSGSAENKVDTTVNTVDAGLESIVKLFEDFRSSSETELLAARDQYAELEAVRKNISTINTKFISLGGSIAETIALFSSIGDSIKIVGAKFIELGNDVASGKTKPTEVADRGRSITDDEALNQSVKLSMLAESRKYHDQKNSPEFQDVDSRDNIIANRAYKLRERGAKLATTPNTSQENIDNLAKDLLHFGESISKLDEKIKGEAAELLGLNESGKKALFATDVDGTRAKLTKTAFAKNTGIGNVEGIVKSVNNQMSSPDYLNPRNYAGGSLEGSFDSNNIRNLGRLEKNVGSDRLLKLIQKAYQKAYESVSETGGNNSDLINRFEEFAVPTPSQRLSAKDKKILTNKIAEHRERESLLSDVGIELPPETIEAVKGRDNTTVIKSSMQFFAALFETTRETMVDLARDAKNTSDKIKEAAAEAKSKADAIAAPVVKAAKLVKAAKQYYDEKKASLPIDVKAVAVDDDVVVPPSPPKQPVKPPTLKTPPVSTVPPVAPPTQPPVPPVPPTVPPVQPTPPTPPVPPTPPKPPKAAQEPSPPPAPKEPGYPYYAGIVRNNWKASVKADLDRARAAISNELEQTDFVNLQRDQYLQLLKHRLTLAGSDDNTAAAQAKAQLKTQLADLPNQAELTQDRAKSMVEKDDKRQRDLVTKDAKYDATSGRRIDLESIDPSQEGGKDLSRLRLVQSELEGRFTNIVSQSNTLAEIDGAFSKFINDYYDRRLDLNLDKIDKIKSNRIAQIEKSIASAEAKIKTDAKELYKTALAEYQEAIAGGFGGNLDEVRTAARGLETGKDRSNAMKTVYKAKSTADKLESSAISSGEKEDSQSFSNGYRLAKSQFANKLPVSTSNLIPTNDLQRSQLAGLNQKIGTATKTASLANQPLSILEVMDESDKDVAKELDKRYNAIVKTYKEALKLAIAKASKKNETSLVIAPTVPDSYLAPVEPQLLSYQKSQTDAVDRVNKNRSIELRDEGTIEALAELKAGFVRNLKGYASALHQLSAELNKSNNVKEVDLFGNEIKRLRAEVKQTGKIPNYDKLNEAINFNAPQEILDRQFAQLAAIEIELTEKVEQIANIKFNKKLQVARNNFKANGADSVSQGYREDANDQSSPFINDADDLQALAVTKTSKDKLKSFQAELDGAYNKIEEDVAKRRAKQVLQTLSESGHQAADQQLTLHEARYKTEGKTVPEELKAARAKVDRAFQEIIKADVKKVLAEALLLNANTQIENGNFIKSQVPNYSQLTSKNKSSTDKEIESSIEKHNSDFQKSILNNLKLIIAESYKEFDPSDPSKRHHDSPAQLKAKVANYDQLTPLNQIAAESQIASANNYFKTQTTQHDRYQFNEAKSQASNDGDLSGLQAVKDSVSTLAKEAGVLLDKMLADLMKMSTEEREHIADVRAQMNAARSNLTEEKPLLIQAAIDATAKKVATPTTLAPDGSQVKTANTPQYLHQLEYIANQGNKTLQADSKAANGGTDEKKLTIQDIAGYYYTLKSVAGTVAETLHMLGEAAISTTRSMQLLEVANNNDKDRINSDIAAARGLSDKYGAAINDNLQNLGKLKAGAPLEYDKQGEKLPNKVNDDVFYKLAGGLQAAGTVNHLDGQQQASVNLAIQEILGKNQFQSKEVVRQLAQALPGFVPVLASSQGMSTKELRSAMEQGNVGLSALAPLANKLEEIYGSQAQKGTLVKEINTYGGQTKELGQSAATAIAPLAQALLSLVNHGLEASKTNAGTIALVSFAPIVIALNKLSSILFVKFTKDNPIAKEFFGGTGELVKRNAVPIGLLGAGLAISAVGAKFAGENSLDTVMSKFITSLSDAATVISKIFPSLPDSRDPFKKEDVNRAAFIKSDDNAEPSKKKDSNIRSIFEGKDANSSNTNFSSLVGGALVAGGVISAVRKNADYFPNVSGIGSNIANSAGNMGMFKPEDRRFGTIPRASDNPPPAIVSNKIDFRSLAGDLGLSLVSTVAAIAIANTTFVNDYTKVMEESITNLEAAARDIKTNPFQKETIKTLNEREGTDKDGLDKFTNFVNDLIAASSGDLKKMTTQALSNASENDEVGNKYDKEIQRRQKDPNFKLDQPIKTNKSKANEDTVVKGVEALSTIEDLRNLANDDKLYSGDVKDADLKKAKVAELKQSRLKREAAGEVIGIDENETFNTAIENADKEYSDSVLRINNRHKQLVTALKETVKLRDIATKSPGQLPTGTDANLLILSLDSKEKELKTDIKNNQRDIADKYDPASILTRDSTLNEQSIRKLDLDNSQRVIGDTQKSTASIRMRGREGDELASGARKSQIDVDTATSDLALARAKAELAKTYLDIVNSRPGTDEETNAKLKDAIDKNNEAIRKSTDTEKALEQAKQDQKNQIEQTLITKYDNDQNKLNTQFTRDTNVLKTSAEVSLNTRRQPEVDANVAAKLDEAAVAKAKATYEGRLKIADSIVVNKTAFNQQLEKDKVEYQNSIDSLEYGNKTRDRERQGRLESNNNQDFDRKFTRLENSASIARQENTPQNVVFAEATYKRDIAANNVSQTEIDAEAALNKVGEMARLISKIKSPELKLDKTIEYEKLVAEAKKRNYEVESAKIAELKTQYEQVKTIVDSLAEFNTKIQANNIAILEKKRDIEIRDRVASSVSGIGETDTLAEARIKVEESRKFKQQSEGQLERSANSSGDIINAYGANKLSTLAPTDTKGYNSLSDEVKQLGKIANTIAPNLNNPNNPITPENITQLIEVLTRSRQAAVENPISYKDGDKIAVSANLGKSRVINEKLSVPAIDTLISIVRSFQKPVETKYAASETLINSQNALNVAEKVSARELAEDKKKIADQKVEKLNLDSTRESKFVNELSEFATQAKLANSKAPDAQIAISVGQTLNELSEEIRQRSSGGGKKPTRLDVYNTEFANRKKSFEDSIVNVSPEKNLKLTNKYQINEAEKKKTYDGELVNASEKISTALKTQIIEFIKLGEVGHLAYKQLAESLMAIQNAGVNLLKTYGMMQGQVTAVSFSLGADNKYKASSTTYNADDVAQTASVKAGQEVDTQNSSIQEFKKSTAHLADANGGTKINEVIALAKSSGDDHLIRLAEQAQIALTNGKKFDPTEINNFVKLLQAAGKNLVAITDEQRRQITTNAAIAARSEQNSKIYESNASGGESYIKSRQSAYRHGTVETFGDVRDVEDRTTQMYRDKIAANREATISTVIKNGGEDSIDGKIALRQGQNKEREIQNEFADLPLYGKQFSSDIGEAVNSTLKISTIFRESIEKGLGTALIDTFRNFMNKLADTYSDRAAKQLGDMARGGIDNLFGLNAKPEGLDKTLNNTPFDQLKASFTTLDVTTTDLQASFAGLAQAANSVGGDKAIKNDKSLENFFNDAKTGSGGAGDISDKDMGFGATELFDRFKQMPTESKGKDDGGGEHAVSGLLGKLLGGSSGGMGGFGSAIGIFGSLLGFSEGSIPSLSMGSLPSYADGHMGSDYPQTKYQDPRETDGQSHLAVINRNELVLSKAQTEGYMQYKQDMINNSINTNHNNNSTANHYNNTNVSFRDGDSFGNSTYILNKENKTRFDRK